MSEDPLKVDKKAAKIAGAAFQAGYITSISQIIELFEGQVSSDPKPPELEDHLVCCGFRLAIQQLTNILKGTEEFGDEMSKNFEKALLKRPDLFFSLFQ